MRMASATIEYIPVQEKAVIAKFTNGCIKSGHAKDVTFECITNTEASTPSKKQQRVLVAKTGRLSYVAKNDANSKTNPVRYYMGIHDTLTGKMRICDAEIFTLHPQIPGREGDDQLDSQHDQTLGMGFREKRDLLTDAFGSIKKQRAMNMRLKMENYQQKGDTLERDLQTPAGQALSLQNREALDTIHSSAPTESSIMPPCNKEAEKSEDVYKLTDIVAQEDLDSITNQARTFFTCTPNDVKDWTEKEQYPKFILKNLAFLPINEDSRWFKSKCLMYLNYMITLCLLKGHELKKKEILPSEWPDHIKRQLLDKFTMLIAGDFNRKPIRCMPSRLKDKLISYLLVLALHIDQFSTDMKELQIDLKIGERKLSTHFRALGCQVKSHKVEDGATGDKRSVYTAVLSLPLHFPQKAAKLGKRRK